MQQLLSLDINTREVDLDLYPCTAPHREILFELLSSLKSNHINNLKEDDEYLTTSLISMLNSSNNNSINNLPNFPRNVSVRNLSTYEELISIVFQSKPLRHNGKNKGNLIRKRKGIFHTPYSIARIIAKEALLPHIEMLYKIILSNDNSSMRKELYNKLLSLKIIDPACGTGIILSAAVEYLSEINDKLDRVLRRTRYYLPNKEFTNYIVQNNIFGVDIDSEACSTTKAILNSKYALGNNDLSRNIKCGNSILPDNLFDDNNFSFRKEFPSVFSNKGGFDVLLMNPPYERLKIDKSDYHSIYKGEELYLKNKLYVSNLVKTIKDSNEYPLSTQGVLDLYKLFIDRAINITHDKATISFIVPLSLLGDQSCKKIREYLYKKTHINNIYSIPENAKMFYNVSQAFCIIGLQKNTMIRKSTTMYKDVISVSPMVYSNKIQINKDDIKLICPNSLSLPIADAIGWKILNKIHKEKHLCNIDNIINLRGEIDLTFGSKYITNNQNDKPLIRGNMIDAYTLVNTKNNKSSYIKIEALKDLKLIGSKQKYINTTRIVGQQISNMGLKKRLKFTLINTGFVANSCNFLTTKIHNRIDLLALLGLLNSSLLNWRFKLTSTNNHINNYELDELPIVTMNKQNRNIYYKLANLVECQCREYSINRHYGIDLLVFDLYDLSVSEKKYIIESFKS